MQCIYYHMCTHKHSERLVPHVWVWNLERHVDWFLVTWTISRNLGCCQKTDDESLLRRNLYSRPPHALREFGHTVVVFVRRSHHWQEISRASSA